MNVLSRTTCFFLVIGSASCDSPVDPSSTAPPQISAQPVAFEQTQSPPTAFDFGEISVDNGAVRLEHEFIVQNSSSKPVSIEKVKTSCGCVEAKVANSTLQPGESTTLQAAIEVVGTGRTEQSATVVFSNDTSNRYVLRAVGTRSTQLLAVPARTRVSDRSRSIQVTLQLIDRNGQVKTGTPTARIGDQTLPVLYDKWMIIEPRDEVTGRPLRQLTEIAIDVTPYTGSYPVDIEIATATASSPAAEVTVDLFPDPSDGKSG